MKDFMKTMMEFLRSKMFWASMALADAGLGLAQVFSRDAEEPETGSKGLMTADEHKDAVGSPWLPAFPALPPMPVETHEAILYAGPFDGHTVPDCEGNPVILLRNKETGLACAYRRDTSIEDRWVYRFWCEVARKVESN